MREKIRIFAVFACVCLLTSIYTSCSSDTDSDMYPSLSNTIASNNNAPRGDLGAEGDLCLVTADQKVWVNPIDTVLVFHEDDDRDNLILLATISKNVPLPEFTTIHFYIKRPDVDNLQAGQSINCKMSSMESPLSSNSGDYVNYTPNGSSIIARSVSDSLVVLYIDHFCYNFTSGSLIPNGYYYLYGDLTLSKESLKE